MSSGRRRRTAAARSGKRQKSKGKDEGGGREESSAEGLRLDRFLKNVGIVPRRELAQEACRRGLVLLDGKRAKPASAVRAGQELVVRLGMRRRRYKVLDVPKRAVSRATRSDYAQLLEEESLGLDDQG